MSVIVTGTEWEFASGAVVFAAGVGTADRSSAAGGETDGGVNFAAFVALEPCAFVVVVVVVPESAVSTGFPQLCIGKGPAQSSWQGWRVPGGSAVPLETNLEEAPLMTDSSLPTPALAESA